MKQAYFEDKDSAGTCSILEQSDLNIMTVEQLQKELSNWMQQSEGDDPLAYVVEDNIRSVERHIELRGMNDEDLARDLKQVEWGVVYWKERFAEDKCPRSRSMVSQRELEANDYRREQARREGAAENIIENDAVNLYDQEPGQRTVRR